MPLKFPVLTYEDRHYLIKLSELENYLNKIKRYYRVSDLNHVANRQVDEKHRDPLQQLKQLYECIQSVYTNPYRQTTLDDDTVTNYITLLTDLSLGNIILTTVADEKPLLLTLLYQSNIQVNSSGISLQLKKDLIIPPNYSKVQLLIAFLAATTTYSAELAFFFTGIWTFLADILDEIHPFKPLKFASSDYFFLMAYSLSSLFCLAFIFYTMFDEDEQQQFEVKMNKRIMAENFTQQFFTVIRYPAQTLKILFFEPSINKIATGIKSVTNNHGPVQTKNADNQTLWHRFFHFNSISETQLGEKQPLLPFHL